MTPELLKSIIDSVFAEVIKLEGNHAMLIAVTQVIQSLIDANLPLIFSVVVKKLPPIETKPDAGSTHACATPVE